MDEQETRAEINRLYWESNESVGTIAEQVGVSRRGMYDSIEPRPAPGECPSCGGSLGFRNRTALQRREAECLDCGVPSETASTREEASRARSASSTGAAAGEEPQVEQQREGERLSPTRSVPPPARAPLLSGLLLAGMATGAAAAFLLRRH